MADELYRLRREQSVSIIELMLPCGIDTADFDQLNDSLLALLSRSARGRWVVDLAGLGYSGTAVLGLLVNMRQRVLQSDGKLVLCGLSSRLTDVFRTCCLERLFVIRPDQDAAVRVAAG